METKKSVLRVRGKSQDRMLLTGAATQWIQGASSVSTVQGAHLEQWVLKPHCRDEKENASVFIILG